MSSVGKEGCRQRQMYGRGVGWEAIPKEKYLFPLGKNTSKEQWRREEQF